MKKQSENRLIRITRSLLFGFYLALFFRLSIFSSPVQGKIFVDDIVQVYQDIPIQDNTEISEEEVSTYENTNSSNSETSETDASSSEELFENDDERLGFNIKRYVVERDKDIGNKAQEIIKKQNKG